MIRLRQITFATKQHEIVNKRSLNTQPIPSQPEETGYGAWEYFLLRRN